MAGLLSIVATPIGNLEDITLRALRVLRGADLIAAEDTRHTAKLLSHYEIHTPTTSFHEHNERTRLPGLLRRLADGQKIALVSDAGTPGISDPGYRLVDAAREAGVAVEVVPGPSAVIAALVTSGLPTDSFTFLGFPPIRSKARIEWLQMVVDSSRTTVFFESPHRIRATLTELAALAPTRLVAIARELTKIHETLVIKPSAEAIASLPELPKGEFTLVIAPKSAEQIADDAVAPKVLLVEFGELTNNGASSRRDAIRTLATRHGLSSKSVYAAIERAKQSVK
jgi:16S rRNA (cytidine1402-2'-O)-methyltransferase